MKRTPAPEPGFPTSFPDEPYRLLVESVSDYAIFMLDPQGVIRSWNPGAARVKQYRADEIIGQHFSIFYPEDDVKAGKCEFELATAERTGRFEDEDWRLRKDGTRFWANVIITAMRSPDGQLRGFAKVTRDLTDRRAAEQRLRESELRLRLLIESVQDYAIFMLDPDGRVTTWNPGAQNVTLYMPDEIIGKHFSIFYPAEAIQARHPERELEVARQVGRYEEEGWRLRKDGSRYWANVVITAVRDERQDLVGFAKVTRDLTDRKRAEREQAARLAAEDSDRRKDEFLAMLGHELRNPLAPIQTALQLMRLRDENVAVRERTIIARQVGHLERLIDDLLDVSRITRGRVELKRERLEIAEIVAKAVEQADPLLEERKHRLHLAVARTGLLVDGDQFRLAQVFANLLTNAAKYTQPSGTIWVSAGREAEMIVVRVRDSGAGIPPDLLPRIFELFAQAPQTLARSQGGLGLGLAIVQRLVELHGGRVDARSEGMGHGSEFIVRLPVAEARLAARDPGNEPVVAPVRSQPLTRLLVVDDNQDAASLLAEALGIMGYEVRVAHDGPSALAVAASFLPTIALLDIGLPVMDGYELAERLREQLGPTTLRLIAVTGYGQEKDRARAQRAGFVQHLVKPIDLDRLGALLAEKH